MLLASNQYGAVEALTNGTHLSAEEIKAAIEDYGRTITNPPISAWEHLCVVEIRNSVPRKWSVIMPLWTQEEGRSDLSLECTIIEAGQTLTVELDDIHVL